MRASSRLALNVLAWGVSIPVLNVCLTALEQHRLLSLSALTASIVAMVLLFWGVLIYWRCVPSTSGVVERGTYLVAFLVVMALVGMGEIWVAFWATIAIFGL